MWCIGVGTLNLMWMEAVIIEILSKLFWEVMIWPVCSTAMGLVVLCSPFSRIKPVLHLFNCIHMNCISLIVWSTPSFFMEVCKPTATQLEKFYSRSIA